MTVLFVHGLGRTPLSGWRMLRLLRLAGMKTSTLGYTATFESFESIVSRLKKRITELSAADDLIVVGHSLGGIMLRAAINGLPPEATPPKHVFLLGSPMRASRLASWLRNNLLFRMAAGDCGQLLGSAVRMDTIGPIVVPTTSVVGVRGISSKLGPFGDEPNDGVVSVSEVTADWVLNQVEVPVFHSLLPASRRVARIIAETLEQKSS